MQKNDGDEVVKPIEMPSCDLDPPTKIPVRGKLTKSAIKELRSKRRIKMQEELLAKHRMEMHEEQCSERPPGVETSPENLLVLAIVVQTMEKGVHTCAKRRL